MTSRTTAYVEYFSSAKFKSFLFLGWHFIIASEKIWHRDYVIIEIRRMDNNISFVLILMVGQNCHSEYIIVLAAAFLLHIFVQWKRS